MITYRIKTTFGTTYNYIKSWQKWEFDENFLQFVWGRSANGLLVLNKKDILAIEEENV